MPLDSRPQVRIGHDGALRVAGLRCGACGEVTASPWPHCPGCGCGGQPAEFGPEGTVWSSTVVRVPVPDRTPPYALAYVDLDDGPRVLAHHDGPEPAPIGARVRLLEPTDGDLRVQVLR